MKVLFTGGPWHGVEQNVDRKIWFVMVPREDNRPLFEFVDDPVVLKSDKHWYELSEWCGRYIMIYKGKWP